MADVQLDESRLLELVLLALDEQAAPSELEELNQLLRGNEQARERVATFLYDDALLGEEIATVQHSFQALADWGQDQPTADSKWPAVEANAPTAVDPPRPTSLLRRSYRALNRNGALVAAASLLIVALAGWHYASMRSEMNRLHDLAVAPDPFDLDSMQDSSSSVRREDRVARVTAVIDCVWPRDEEPLAFGDLLHVGQRVRLDRGVVQLTLESGARVLVEGPADFVASSRWETQLDLGRVAASVPRSARGYTVLTPTVEIVDLGTEFGVEVEKSGASQFHVFDGEIVARRLGNDASFVHASVEHAYRFNPSCDSAPVPIKGIGDSFLRQIKRSTGSDKLDTLPVTEGLALWLAADAIPNIAEGQGVRVWPDLLVGENKFADDAMQFEERRCPTFMRDAAGHAAVEFDGSFTALATGPTDLTTHQTTYIVCAAEPQSFAKHAHGGVMVRTGPLAIAMTRDRTPIGWVWAGERANPRHVGKIRGNTVEPDEICLVCYEYDSDRQTASISVNGQAAKPVKAPLALPTQSRRYIGRSDVVSQQQYFHGRIYEVVVYESMLSPEQRSEVNEYLAGRYDLSVAE